VPFDALNAQLVASPAAVHSETFCDEDETRSLKKMILAPPPPGVRNLSVWLPAVRVLEPSSIQD
jgi:hypothetical protein